MGKKSNKDKNAAQEGQDIFNDKKMKTSYASFQEFKKENKDIFNLLPKSAQGPLLEAIWKARDSEVELLKEQTLELGKRLSLFLESQVQREKEYNFLNENLREYQEKSQHFELKSSSYQKKLEELTGLNASLHLEVALTKEAMEKVSLEYQTQKDKAEKTADLLGKVQEKYDDLYSKTETLENHLMHAREKNVELEMDLEDQEKKLEENIARSEYLMLDNEQMHSLNEHNKSVVEQLESHLDRYKANAKVLQEITDKSREEAEVLRLDSSDLRVDKRKLLLEREKMIQEKEKIGLDLEESQKMLEEQKETIRHLHGLVQENRTELYERQLKIQELAKDILRLESAKAELEDTIEKKDLELKDLNLKTLNLKNELSRVNQGWIQVQSTLALMKANVLNLESSALFSQEVDSDEVRKDNFDSDLLL